MRWRQSRRDVSRAFPGYAFFFLALTTFSGVQGALAAPTESIGYVAKLINQPIHGQCSATLNPDRAVISVIIMGEGDKPATAKQQLAALERKAREIAAGTNAHVQSFELVRYARGAPAAMPAVPYGAPLPKPPANASAFVFIQRLDLEFPLNADVDSVLDKLVGAGINRFGKMITPHQVYAYQPTATVRYVVSDPRKKLENVHAQCRAVAMENWCTAHSLPDGKKTCVAELNRYGERITTQNMYLRSQNVMREQGGNSQVMVNYPWQPQQFETLEFLSKDPLRLDGNITMRLTQ